MLLLPVLVLVLCWTVVGRHQEDIPSQRLTWMLAGAGTVVVLVFLIQAFRGMPQLTLSREDFTTRLGFSSKQYPWSEYYGFSIQRTSGVDMIRFLRKGWGTDYGIMNLYVASSEEICETLLESSERYGVKEADA
jgi:hypothetical protein